MEFSSISWRASVVLPLWRGPTNTTTRLRASALLSSESMAVRLIMTHNTMNIRHVKMFFHGILNIPTWGDRD
jgi:hypothetical protein